MSKQQANLVFGVAVLLRPMQLCKHLILLLF